MTIDELKLGTPEAAVRSCVNLFARLFEVPEEYVACYLDMYYQLRLRAEERKWTEESFAEYVKCDPLLRHVSGFEQTEKPDGDGGSPRAQTSSECRTLPARQNAPAQEAAVDAAGADIIRPRTLDEDGAAVDSPPAAPSIVKKPRPERKGNDYAKKAAEFKREVREKLAAARAAGVTSGMIMEKVKPGSALTEGRLWDIMGARLAPVEAYRVLDEVLMDLPEANSQPGQSPA